jgi:hypothetical protein
MNKDTKNNSKSISQPDERRNFVGHGHLDLVKFDDGVSVGRAEFEPGWKWEVDVKPIAGTRTCEATHSGFCLSGSMEIHIDNGDRFTIHGGDAYYIPPGHTAEVNGSEKCVMIDVGGFTSYAKPKTEAA